MTTKDDPIVERFFDELKQRDQAGKAPEMLANVMAKQRSQRRRRVVAIAASVTLLLLAVWAVNRPKSQSEVDIAVVEQDIESMMSWESATGSLIENR